MIQVAGIEAQRCDRPQLRRGVGTFVADDVVLTAGHVVEGSLRRLMVDGRPAQVIALDPDLDLALVRMIDDPAAAGVQWWSEVVATAGMAPVEAGDAVRIRTTTGDVETSVSRLLRLRIDDLTRSTVRDRRSIELDHRVEPGDSGSPVIGPTGHVVGVVVLRRGSNQASYATPVPLLDELLVAGLALAGNCA